MFTLRQNWYLPQLHKVKKSLMFFFHYIFVFTPLSLSLTHFIFVWVTLAFSPAHPFSLSWSTCAFSAASITYSTSSSLALPQSAHSFWFPLISLTITLLLTLTSLTPYFLVSLHLWSAFPYLRFPLWLADKYIFGGPPQVTAFSFPGWNGFSACLHCQWSYRTFCAYSVDSYLLHRYSKRAEVILRVRHSSHL